MHAENLRPSGFQPRQSHQGKLWSMVQEGYLHPILDQSQWEQMISDLMSMPEQRTMFRARRVCARGAFFLNIYNRWQTRIEPIENLEWIELKAESMDWLTYLLYKHRIPYSIEKGVPRVWVYVRSGVQPEWQR